MSEPEHSADCAYPYGRSCLSFSTDGTRLGAKIAHAMGTTDEAEITRMGRGTFESDVEAEQADWEADECEG